MHSACDIAAESQRCLMAHEATGRPRHVFVDVLDRLYPSDREALEAVRDEVLGKWQRVLESAQKHDNAPASYIGEQRRRLGEEMRHRLLGILREVEFQPEAFCVIHGRKCPLDPRADPELRTYMHIEAAGNTCTPWSTAGSRSGWLSSCTLVALVWACHARFWGPDIVVNECVPALESEVVDAKVFQDTSPGIPKNPFKEGIDSYVFQVICFNATSMGIPARRERKWSIWRRSNQLGVAGEVSFDLVFFRSMACSSEVFLQATEEMVHEDIIERGMKLVGLGGAEVEALFVKKAEVVMQPGQHGRLRAWRDLAHEKGRIDKRSKTTCHKSIIVDLSQNAEWSAVGVGACFPLKRNSEPFDLVAGRPLLLWERFLVHGFPVPGLAPPSTSSRFPFTSLLGPGGLSNQELTSLSGNGMVLQVAGAVLLDVLGTSA